MLRLNGEFDHTQVNNVFKHLIPRRSLVVALNSVENVVSVFVDDLYLLERNLPEIEMFYKGTSNVVILDVLN